MSILSKEFLDSQATIECGFTLKHLRDMARTYSQMNHTDKYSQLSSIICPVWLNVWVVLSELSGCGFECSCSHLKFIFLACFQQGVPLHSGNYIIWIHSNTPTWHEKNIQSNPPNRSVLSAQLNYLGSFANWLIVCFRTNGLWFWVQLQSVKINLSRLFRATNSFTFRQL